MLAWQIWGWPPRILTVILGVLYNMSSWSMQHQYTTYTLQSRITLMRKWWRQISYLVLWIMIGPMRLGERDWQVERQGQELRLNPCNHAHSTREESTVTLYTCTRKFSLSTKVKNQQYQWCTYMDTYMWLPQGHWPSKPPQVCSG